MADDNSTVSGMAGRYARALFELALDSKAVDAVKADLERFEAMMAQSPDLQRLVRSPVFGADEQAKALAAVLAKAEIAGLAAKFLLFVASNRRLFAVRDMLRDFRALLFGREVLVVADRVHLLLLFRRHVEAATVAAATLTTTTAAATAEVVATTAATLALTAGRLITTALALAAAHLAALTRLRRVLRQIGRAHV